MGKMITRGGDHLGRGDGTVEVPATYQSDDPPRMALDSMRAAVRGRYDYGEPSNPPREAMPLKLTLELSCNAEAVARLAEFFGVYDREAWNKQARLHGLPEAGGDTRVSPPELPAPTPEFPAGVPWCKCGYPLEDHDRGDVPSGCTKYEPMP